jgi:hypothetical protein
MGECNYYLKARFASAEAVEQAAPRLADLLAEGEQARDYWQSSRPDRTERHTNPNWQPANTEQFWRHFRKAHPATYHYLADLAGAPDWDNSLAGQLSCMVDPREERSSYPSATLLQEDELLFLTLRRIWHCAEMGLLERYLRDELGALAVGSVSEDDVDLPEDDRDEDDWDANDWEDDWFFDAIEV